MFSFVENGFNKRPDIYFEKRTVPTNTLKDIFEANGISEVLLMSVDVEGFELDVVKGIDFNAVLIRCIIIENNSKSLYGSDDIREYLIKRNFNYHARIGHLDDVFVHASMIRGD